jgi:hypothetical protein
MTLLAVLGTVALYAPFLGIAAILGFSRLRRSTRDRGARNRRSMHRLSGSLVAMGLGFQQLQLFYRPSMAYVLEAKQDEDADEDDAAEPETPLAHFHRQLRRIRRGEKVDRLVLRL